MRPTFTFLLGAILSGSAIASAAQPETGSVPHAVTLCELVQNPRMFDGRWVAVHAGIEMEFEDFSLYDGACNVEQRPGVWLTFGGDQKEIATYCCVNPNRKQGVDIEIAGHRVPLVRDDALRKFLRVLRSQRLRRPDGQGCESSECFYYRPITATLNGLFLAGDLGGKNLTPGYGHLGCCHLLVIKQVSEVSAERTPVPAGGQFSCSEETWTPRSDIISIENLLACTGSDNPSCGRDRKKAFVRISEHWKDKVDVQAGHSQVYGDVSGNTIGDWISADLLTMYSTKVGKESGSVSVTRKICAPASKDLGPKPASAVISCLDHSIEWDDDPDIAKEVHGMMDKGQFAEANARITEVSKAILSDGDQSWRSENTESAAWHVLRTQAQRWGVFPDTKLGLDKCDDSSLPDDQLLIIGCNWYSPDGIQEFHVTLAKYPRSSDADPAGKSISWSVWNISANTCHFETSDGSSR